MTIPIAMVNFTPGLASLFLPLDRDVSAQTLMNKKVYSIANVYAHGANSEFLNWYTILGWQLRGAVQGIVSAWIVLSIYGPGSTSDDGTTWDHNTTSMVAYTAVILIQTFTIFFEANIVTWINNVVIWGMLLFYLMYFLFLGNVMFMSLHDMYGIPAALFAGALPPLPQRLSLLVHSHNAHRARALIWIAWQIPSSG